MDSFIGSVMAVSFNYAPAGWHACDGAILPIQQYAALYSLIGPAFGGDGRTNFALPDLRGRVVVGMGQSGNSPNYNIGQNGGSASTTLTVSNLPAHTHTVPAPTINVSTQKATESVAGTSDANTLGVAINNATLVDLYVNDPAPSVPLVTGAQAGATGSVGANAAFSVMQPYLTLNYIICVNGIFPPRQ